MCCAFYAVSRMPLSTLSAVTFTMPLFVTVMSYPLLKERVGWHRGGATVAGFIGVFIMLGPQLMGFHPVYLIALASAVCFALAAIALRQLGDTESPLTTFLYFTLICMVLAGIPLPWVWQTPDALGWLCLIGAGIVGGLAQYFLVKAYSLAPASIVAPFEYTRLLWASLIALVVWAEVPSLRVLLGAVLVIGAGWYITHREVPRA